MTSETAWDHLSKLTAVWRDTLSLVASEHLTSLAEKRKRELRLKEKPHEVIVSLLSCSLTSMRVIDAISQLKQRVKESDDVKAGHRLLEDTWDAYREKLYQSAKLEYFEPQERKHPSFTFIFFDRLTFSTLFTNPIWQKYCSLVPDQLRLLRDVLTFQQTGTVFESKSNKKKRAREQSEDKGGEQENIVMQFREDSGEVLVKLMQWSSNTRLEQSRLTGLTHVAERCSSILQALDAAVVSLEKDELSFAYDHVGTYEAVCQKCLSKVVEEWIKVNESGPDEASQNAHLQQLEQMVESARRDTLDLSNQLSTLHGRFFAALDFKSRERRTELLSTLYRECASSASDGLNLLGARNFHDGVSRIRRELRRLKSEFDTDADGVLIAMDMYRRSNSELVALVDEHYLAQLQVHRKSIDTLCAIKDVAAYVEGLVQAVQQTIVDNEAWHPIVSNFIRTSLHTLQANNYMPDRFRQAFKQQQQILVDVVKSVKTRLANQESAFRQQVENDYTRLLQSVADEVAKVKDDLFAEATSSNLPPLHIQERRVDQALHPKTLELLQVACKQPQSNAVQLLERNVRLPADLETFVIAKLTESKRFMTLSKSTVQEAWEGIYALALALSGLYANCSVDDANE